MGYKVLDAGSGEEALKTCEKNEEAIGLLLTDVVMSGMSGRDLSYKVEQLRSGIKVLFMSGYTDHTMLHHGVLEEGIEFIQKPFSAEGLAQKVRDTLDI